VPVPSLSCPNSPNHPLDQWLEIFVENRANELLKAKIRQQEQVLGKAVMAQNCPEPPPQGWSLECRALNIRMQGEAPSR
jgi:hypothetical protein